MATSGGQPCWIIDRNESNNTWLDHVNEHSCHVWSHLLQWFSRRRLKWLRTDDGRQVMAIAHMTLWVTWAKKFTDSLFLFKTLINKYINCNKKQIFSCFIDLRKAFDSVWRKGLFYKLLASGVGHKTNDIIQNMYSKTWVIILLLRIALTILLFHLEVKCLDNYLDPVDLHFWK
jgi:hypothetical protein